MEKKFFFIDCGSNIGDTIELFLQKYKNAKKYQIIAFEPNKDLAKYYKRFTNVVLYQKAVWIADETKKFYVGTKNQHSTNSRLDDFYYGRKKTKYKTEPEIVECIDFSQYIKSNFNLKDNIILKMDIEGAEYFVLTKMITDNTISYINEIYIEFHETQNTQSFDKNKILKKIQEMGVKISGNFNGGVEFKNIFENQCKLYIKKKLKYLLGKQ